MASLTVTARVLPHGRPFTVRGRDAWALLELHRAGPKGCTPIDKPGPRWSAYVHNLRHEHGLAIDTVHESHRGAFPGNHARYVLRSTIEIVLGTFRRAQTANPLRVRDRAKLSARADQYQAGPSYVPPGSMTAHPQAGRAGLTLAVRTSHSGAARCSAATASASCPEGPSRPNKKALGGVSAPSASLQPDPRNRPERLQWPAKQIALADLSTLSASSCWNTIC